jgi:hypothetical protein
MNDAGSEMTLEGVSEVVSVAKARNSAKTGWKRSLGVPASLENFRKECNAHLGLGTDHSGIRDTEQILCS